MKSTKILLVFACITWIFSSCVTNKDYNLFQDISKEYPKMKEPEYKVIVGDQLAITIYTLDQEALEEVLGSFVQGGELNVRADGTIKIPYLGKVYVEGLTLYEIGKLLSEKFSTLAQGTTATVHLASMYVTFLNEQRGYRVDMDKPIMTIYEVLSVAERQRTNVVGDRKKVNIIRQTAQGSVLKEFDLRSKDIVDSEFYFIQPNDVIYIPRLSRDAYTGTSATTLAGTLGLLTGVASFVILLLRLF